MAFGDLFPTHSARWPGSIGLGLYSLAGRGGLHGFHDSCALLGGLNPWPRM